MPNSTEIILERLKKALNFKKDVELARFFEVSIQTYSAWKRRDSIPFKHIQDRCPDVSYDWLFKGEGPMSTPSLTVVAEPTSPYKQVQLPLVDFRVPVLGCRYGGCDRPEIVDYVTSTSWWLRDWVVDVLKIEPEKAFIVDVLGPAMSGKFEEGDKVIGSKQDAFDKPGIYAVWLSGAVMIRKIQVVDNLYFLSGWDPDFQVRAVPVDTPMQFIGKIVGCMVHVEPPG